MKSESHIFVVFIIAQIFGQKIDSTNGGSSVILNLSKNILKLKKVCNVGKFLFLFVHLQHQLFKCFNVDK